MRIISLRKIEAHLDTSPWRWAVENRERIEANWARRLLEKPAIFNGIVLVCTHIAVDGDVLRARLREAEYSALLAMIDYGFPEPGVGNCFGAAALRASDGAFVLGEMASHTANGGRVYFPGGNLDRADLRADGSIDIDGSVRRELLEEVGLGPDDVVFEDGWTAIINGPRTALLKQAFSPLPAEALKARIETFLAREAEPELSGVRLVRSSTDVDPSVMPVYVTGFINQAFSTLFNQVG
ncbi:NUDIX hydrolase [Pseudochelatococcus sp. G4_1912]|uniref:NUDIX hydrolase n=1 Tax=Pseudochelatococcus sp. G4_1912 TaxID=3114288 RepID=UPI0039C6BBB8